MAKLTGFAKAVLHAVAVFCRHHLIAFALELLGQAARAARRHFRPRGFRAGMIALRFGVGRD
jgi:hypothetical protein